MQSQLQSNKRSTNNYEYIYYVQNSFKLIDSKLAKSRKGKGGYNPSSWKGRSDIL